MTTILETTFDLPLKIALGLKTGKYKRYGGIIRNSKGQIIAHLKEIPLKQTTDALTAIGNISSVLNLAVSTMQFGVLLHRLNLIAKQISGLQDTIQLIDSKIDLSFYANFRAALDLAHNAFTFTKLENRKISAMQAINRFLEAEQYYVKFADDEIEKGTSLAGKYLLTLSIAFIAEVQCYLELEEVETAQRRLEVGKKVIRPRYENYVKTLLTTNPAAYLHPQLKDKIDLERLTKIYQWLDPSITEGRVFEQLRPGIFELAKNQKSWIDSLPVVFEVNKTNTFEKIRKALPNSLSKSEKPLDGKSTDVVFEQLPRFMGTIEEAIESDVRFEGYSDELGLIMDLDMTYQEWKRLMPASSYSLSGERPAIVCSVLSEAELLQSE